MDIYLIKEVCWSHLLLIDKTYWWLFQWRDAIEYIFFFMWADVYKSLALTCYKCTRYFCLFYFDKDIYNLRATKRHAAEIERIKAHDTDTGVNTQTSVQWHWYTLKRETTRACILLKYADICATLLGITENLYHNVKKYKWLLIF